MADQFHVRDLSCELGEFEFRQNGQGNGLTISGYIARFNEPTVIEDFLGRYTEEIAPGAFDRTLATRGAGKVKMQFNHGHDPAFGQLPIGVWTSMRADKKGLWGEGQIHDTWHTVPIRAAIESGALDGQSFKFKVIADTWRKGTGKELDHRTLTEVAMAEAGPVVNQAYATTSVSLRSQALALYRQMGGAGRDIRSIESEYVFLPRQQKLYAEMEDLVDVFGKFDQTSGADGAHYMADNPFVGEGLACANCAFFEGPRGCELVAGDVDPAALCKLWVIPESLVAVRSTIGAATMTADKAAPPVGGTSPNQAVAGPPVGITRREMRLSALSRLGEIPNVSDRGAA
jgi:uncharacterized protein